ncbi:MAG TPA: molybdopterin-synthase adenylyltransferase MoeB [Kineosporiaceae bacterium]|nr:molybdopterin-synthase adenylyltransferase MoeB [Kineosporiaceae bacterium]
MSRTGAGYVRPVAGEVRRMSLPPLVEPGPPLSVEQIRRYSRHLILPDVGMTGQRRLANARVLVVGGGGLGSPALMYLAAAGVGTLGIVDADVVDATNLQRQVIHGEPDLGRLKTDSAADRIRELNPAVRVRTHPVLLDSSNALEILGDYDLVLDGTDNFPTRYLVGDACALLGLPEVWGSIFRFDGQVSVFWAGHGPTYRDLFAEPPPPGAVPSCAEGGVLGALCAAIGSVMAIEAVKLICGIGRPLLGRLLVFDALDLSWRELSVRPNPDLEPVTELTDYEAFCGLPSAATPGAATPGAVTPGAMPGAGTGEPPVTGPDGHGPADLRSRGLEAFTIDVHTLRRMLADRDAGRDDFVLVDVREPYEREIVAIPGAISIPTQAFLSGEAFAQLPSGRRIVLHCKSGGRSAQALAALHAAGRTDAVHVGGGVLAWVREIEPQLPTY